MTLNKTVLMFSTLILAGTALAMSLNTLTNPLQSAGNVVVQHNDSAANHTTAKVQNELVLSEEKPPPVTVPPQLLKELMAAMIEQGLANGTYTAANLPEELRPFVRLNPASSRDVYLAAEEITEQEEERIAAIEAMFDDDYVPPEPEFQCPDPYDPGPQWQGSHGRMILEERGCTTY